MRHYNIIEDYTDKKYLLLEFNDHNYNKIDEYFDIKNMVDFSGTGNKSDIKYMSDSIMGTKYYLIHLEDKHFDNIHGARQLNGNPISKLDCSISEKISEYKAYIRKEKINKIIGE